MMYFYRFFAFSLRVTCIIIFFLDFHIAVAQDMNPGIEFDNMLYFGNRVTWGQDRWKNSAEFQVRFQDDYRELQRWFLEYVGSFLFSENFEIAPDFRYTVLPEDKEYRPGLSLIYKNLFANSQMVHQLKYQYDISQRFVNSQTIRYAPQYNHLFSEYFIGFFMGAVYYTFSQPYSGLDVLLGGAGIAYIFDAQHTINLSYMLGMQKDIENDSFISGGILMFRVIINIRPDYVYVPAKYVNF